MGKYLTKVLQKDNEVIAGVRDKRTINFSGEIREIPTLSSKSDWSGLFEDIDVIVHLAARVHVMNETAVDPLEEFLEVNSRAVLRMAEAAAEQKVKRFIFMSTIKVHGEGAEEYPYTDTDVPEPVDPYGISKWQAEEALRNVSKTSQMEVVILRSPVVYGEGVKGNIELFYKLVKLGIPLPFGLANNRRTMLSLQNLSVWVNRAITAESPPNKAVLMGDPKPISTKVLAQSLALGMGKRSLLIPIPITLMSTMATALGKKSIIQRLFGNLEILPSFEAFPGIDDELVSSETEIRSFAAGLASR